MQHMSLLFLILLEYPLSALCAFVYASTHIIKQVLVNHAHARPLFQSLAGSPPGNADTIYEMFTRVDRRARAATDWRACKRHRLCGRIVARPLERRKNKIKYRIVFKSIGVFVHVGALSSVRQRREKWWRSSARAVTFVAVGNSSSEGAPALVCGSVAWNLCMRMVGLISYTQIAINVGHRSLTG